MEALRTETARTDVERANVADEPRTAQTFDDARTGVPVTATEENANAIVEAGELLDVGMAFVSWRASELVENEAVSDGIDR